MKERSLRARPDVVVLVKDRCRRSQQISTDQWKMRLSRILLLLHTIETHGDTAASGETAQASLLRSNNSPKTNDLLCYRRASVPDAIPVCAVLDAAGASGGTLTRTL